MSCGHKISPFVWINPEGEIHLKLIKGYSTFPRQLLKSELWILMWGLRPSKITWSNHIIEKVNDKVLDNGRAKASEIPENVVISKERTPKPRARWESHFPNVDKKSTIFIKMTEPDRFLSGDVTMDKALVYQHATETKEQPKKWAEGH